MRSSGRVRLTRSYFDQSDTHRIYNNRNQMNPMSSCNTTRITCPKCQHPQDFTIWNSVNVDLDSSLKDRLLSGELSRFMYGCGKLPLKI